MSLTTFRTLVRGVHKVPIGASATLTEAEETQSLTSAIEEYSRHRPRELTAHYTPSGNAQEYALTNWVGGWSNSINQVVRLVAFVGTDYERTLDSREYTYSIHSDGTAWLRFLPRIPDSYVITLVYFGAHSIADPATNTVPTEDQPALVQLAAAYVLQNAANKFSLNAASSVQADSVTQSDQAKSYSFQSDDARKNFEDHIRGTKTLRSARVGWDLDHHNGFGRMFNRGRRS